MAKFSQGPFQDASQRAAATKGIFRQDHVQGDVAMVVCCSSVAVLERRIEGAGAKTNARSRSERFDG